MNTIAVVCMLPLLIAVIDAACDGKQCGDRCTNDGGLFGLCNQDGECVQGGGLNCATCRSVTVLNVWSRKAKISTVNGDVGEYFSFSAEEFSKMVGSENWKENWKQTKFRIVQNGSHTWEGMIRVWIPSGTDTPVGVKSDGSADGDWKVSDTITLKRCSNPDLHPCKDVTFGDCESNENVKSKILSKKSSQRIQLCNAECYDTDNCTTYRYNNQTKECTLMNDEYRYSCNIFAGPMDKKVSDCLGQIDNQICDSHLEEDCEYDGELLFSLREGVIFSPDDCQGVCEDQQPDCKYWIFNARKNLCILKKDGRKTCNVWGGPKQPSYEHCKYL